MAVTISGTDGITTPTTLNNATSFGYTTGSGGTVTQLTNKSTAVTLNKATGKITMNTAALAGNTSVQFILNNTSIKSEDIVLVQIADSATFLAYLLWSEQSRDGFVRINLRNITAGSLSEGIVISFAIVKGATF